MSDDRRIRSCCARTSSRASRSCSPAPRAAPAGGGGRWAAAVEAACAALGARVSRCELAPTTGIGAAMRPRSSEAVDRRARRDAAASTCWSSTRPACSRLRRGERRGAAGRSAAAWTASWNVTRARRQPGLPARASGGGRIVYLAPPPDAGEHADAARAGLENLARTLSIEWARLRDHGRRDRPRREHGRRGGGCADRLPGLARRAPTSPAACWT